MNCLNKVSLHGVVHHICLLIQQWKNLDERVQMLDRQEI